MPYTLAFTNRETYQQRQAILDADYNTALELARACIRENRQMTPAELQAEHDRALFAMSADNANWSRRTPSPLTIKQVKANDAAATRLKHECNTLRAINSLFN